MYPNATVIKAAGQFVPFRTNAEKDGKALAGKYGVTGYPTILFLSADGMVLDKIGGYEPAPAFTGDLNRIATDIQEFPILQARVKAHPEDTASAIKLAGTLLRRGDRAGAMTLITTIEKKGPEAKAQLAPLYLQLGTESAEKNNFVDAVGWFNKTIAVSKDPAQLGAAHLNLGICDLEQKKMADATTEANAVIALDGAAPGDKAMAQRVLDYIKAHPAK